MSAPVPPPDAGSAAIRPTDARAFAGRVDALEQGVIEAHEALARLAVEPLAIGSGADNAAIAAWYRDLVSADTVPAARTLAGELEGVRRAVREGAAAWEHTESGAAATFRADPGPT